MSDFRFRALISVVFQPLCPACSLFLFRRINDDDDEVILQIIFSKCMPILMYGLEILPLQKNQLNSLDFVINRMFIKLFRTTDIRIISLCQELFDSELSSVQLIVKNCEYIFCTVFYLVKFVF